MGLTRMIRHRSSVSVAATANSARLTLVLTLAHYFITIASGATRLGRGGS